ncbi:D-lactate dehydrogenase [Sphingomonas nostoxanthinifaciens]|uniref:D-lactate dehydrogenase n=1 Tax=Sphingomonas nostoxanthinifaciens TaxID=2872652 RepID=UPI0021D9B54B|nr:D-lactate dehydrogenase [Sphingomonas nostoxanthinifaciens]
MSIVGRRHVLFDVRATRRFRIGYRYGGGEALAVVQPGSLVEFWQVAQQCLSADVIVIVQAANTGLTGGSTPSGDGYDRSVVIISTGRIKGIQLVNGCREAICLAGSTLYELETVLARSGRQPHSVIGSSCIGASVVGGICNNSGGALVQRGPAYTERALFGRVDAGGCLVLVNHLGIALGDDPEVAIRRLEAGEYTSEDIAIDDSRLGSDRNYANEVRDVDHPSPARFNADPRRLFEASGCAGRLIVFAVRVDTFPADGERATFYIGTNNPAALTRLRRDMLSTFESLPVTGEYLDRAAFDIAARYGKDVFLAINWLGTRRLPALFSLRNRVDAMTARVGLGSYHLSDRLLQAIARLFPAQIPKRIREFQERFEHHLILTMSGAGITEARKYLEHSFDAGQSSFFECDQQEAHRAFIHRFTVAGAAIRFRAIHSRCVADIISLDVALPRNALAWMDRLEPSQNIQMLYRLSYGHFFCHVFHRDYIVRKGCDIMVLKESLLSSLDAQGAEYPAEHNVGQLYRAKPELAEFYRSLDPANVLNPGVGNTSRNRMWR